jgi:hypothetical protein
VSLVSVVGCQVELFASAHLSCRGVTECEVSKEV